MKNYLSREEYMAMDEGEAALKKAYDPTEQDEVIEIFAEMLRFATRDGGVKRAAGEKVSWKVDPEHKAAVWSHFKRREQGELQDPDSGAHPYVHAAWRLLAKAWQETHAAERHTGSDPW